MQALVACALLPCCVASDCEAGACETDEVSALQSQRDLTRRASLVEGSSVTKLEASFDVKSLFFGGEEEVPWLELPKPIHMVAIKATSGDSCSTASAIQTEQGCKAARVLLDEVEDGKLKFYGINRRRRPAGCYHWGDNKVVWNKAKSQVRGKVKQAGRFSICSARLTEVELKDQCAEAMQLVTESACVQAAKLLSEQLHKKLYWDTTENSQRPAGCYYWEDQASVIWNDVQTGNAFQGRQPLCIKSFEPNDNKLHQGHWQAKRKMSSGRRRAGKSVVQEQVDMIAIKDSGVVCTDESAIKTERGCEAARAHLDKALAHRLSARWGLSDRWLGFGVDNIPLPVRSEKHGKLDFLEINQTNRPAGCYHWLVDNKRVVVWNSNLSQSDVVPADRFSICKARVTEVELHPWRGTVCAESKTIVTEFACLQAASWLGLELQRPLIWRHGGIRNSKRPKGCYYWEKEDKVVWNDVQNGRAVEGRKPICIKATNVDN